jgi:hypothetical protein
LFRQARLSLTTMPNVSASMTFNSRHHNFTMILRIASLIAALFLIKNAAAEIIPEITTLAEGYNLIAKLPCIDCPFLYQDTSAGEDGPWKSRQDENALVHSNLCSVNKCRN